MNTADANIFEDLKPTDLARCFSAILRQWLTDSEIANINAANAASGYNASTCGSHDYCDSNMAMLEAVSNATGIPVDDIDVDASDAQFCELLNEAWAIAKRADFDTRRIDT
jgi:hypothetical protein